MTEHDIPLDAPPAPRLAAAVERFGEASVVERSLSLMAGNNEGDEFLLWVGGRHAEGILGGAPALYWPELWGLRALLHVWSDDAVEPVRTAFGDQAWRIREMACRVAAERGVTAADVAEPLLTDDVARVRAAAARAWPRIGGDPERLAALLRDPEIDVRRSAQQAIDAAR